MEVSSGVIGAVGLLMQLGKSIKDLCDFIESIQDAPQDLAALTQELKAVGFVLRLMPYAEESNERRVGMHHVLEGCKEPLSALHRIVDEISQGLGSKNKLRRHWTKMEWTWKAETIAKFKGRLNDAKLNIMMAQISLSCQDLSAILQCLSFDIQKIAPSPPLQTREVQLKIELPQAVQFKDDATVQQAPPQHVQHLIPGNTRFHASPTQSFSKRRQPQIQKCESTKVRTLLGTIHYSTTTYRVTRRWMVRSGDECMKSNCTTDLETETTVKFVPYQWAARFAINRVVQMNMPGTWLPRNISLYKLIPSSSLIFALCREGNIEAVRLMLKRGDASVRDISEYGETLLHAAASFCHDDICEFLLLEGADPSLVEDIDEARTPFDCACNPGKSDSMGRWDVVVPYDRLMATLRLFVRYGEAFDSRSWLFALTDYEMRYAKDKNAAMPSQWIIDDILPSLDPYNLDGRWWQYFLIAAIQASTMHPLLLKILGRCNMATVRAALLYWIFTLKQASYTDDPDGSQAEFEALVRHSGGLSFIQSFCGKLYSPLSAAMESRNSFVNFRTLLQRSPWNIRNLIHEEILL